MVLSVNRLSTPRSSSPPYSLLVGVGEQEFAEVHHRDDVEVRQQLRVCQIDVAEIGEVGFGDAATCSATSLI